MARLKITPPPGSKNVQTLKQSRHIRRKRRWMVLFLLSFIGNIYLLDNKYNFYSWIIQTLF